MNISPQPEETEEPKETEEQNSQEVDKPESEKEQPSNRISIQITPSINTLSANMIANMVAGLTAFKIAVRGRAKWWSRAGIKVCIAG